MIRERNYRRHRLTLDWNEVRAAQSVAVIRYLPMLIIGNGLSSTIGYLGFVKSEISRDLTPLAVGIWLLLVPLMASWLRLRRHTVPHHLSKRRLHEITVCSGVLGAVWAGLQLWYLPTAPFGVSALLMANCALLAVGSVAVLYVLPWACVAYATPMMAAAIFISAQSKGPVGPPFLGLLALISAGMLWFLSANYPVFLNGLARRYETNRRLAKLAAELQEQKDLVRAKEEAKAELRRANAALRALAQTDHLTGLPNRRGFEHALRDQWLASQQEPRAWAVLLIDADRFKTINDRYGHGHGDGCLRLIATALENCGECLEIISRYGGDEFAAIHRDDAGHAVADAAECIRSAVETAGASFGLTVSIGVATCYVGHTLTTSELLERADEALYRAKRQGRNQVVTAPPAEGPWPLE